MRKSWTSVQPVLTLTLTVKLRHFYVFSTLITTIKDAHTGVSKAFLEVRTISFGNGKKRMVYRRGLQVSEKMLELLTSIIFFAVLNMWRIHFFDINPIHASINTQNDFVSVVSILWGTDPPTKWAPQKDPDLVPLY